MEGRRGAWDRSPSNEKAIFLWRESPDRVAPGRESGADRAGLLRVSCYTGTWSPLDIYHHLPHRLRQQRRGIIHNNRRDKGGEDLMWSRSVTLELRSHRSIKSTVKTSKLSLITFPQPFARLLAKHSLSKTVSVSREFRIWNELDGIEQKRFPQGWHRYRLLVIEETWSGGDRNVSNGVALHLSLNLF